MGPLGLPELIIIGVIALLIFGPKKLPELGAGLGQSIRDFKSALSGTGGDDKHDEDEPTPPKTEPKAVSQSPAAPIEETVKKA